MPRRQARDRSDRPVTFCAVLIVVCSFVTRQAQIYLRVNFGAPVDFRALARGGFVSNPVPQTDAVFLKHFVQLIVALMGVAALLIALASYFYGKHPTPENPAQARVIEERLAPVGAVYAGETGRAALAAAAEAAKAAAASQVAYGGTTDGSVIYTNLCSACHGTGAGGAPKLTDKAHWGPRIALGVETLVKHATEGYTGSSGMMPARGGNPALTDEQVKATVEWMIAEIN
jgi:cytochrome c5